MFTPDPIPRPTGPPASSAPFREYVAAPRPGVDARHTVLPRSLVEAMPLPWQQHFTYLLAEFHQAYAHITWPIYRVVPSRYEKLIDLDEDQLAEVGYLVEIDSDGELVYRERNGDRVEDPARTTVLVSCLDPIPPPQAQAAPPPPQAAPPPPQAGPPQAPAAAGPPSGQFPWPPTGPGQPPGPQW